MNILRTILFFPLALARFILFLIWTIVILIIGSVKYKKNGFTRELQVWVMTTWGKVLIWIIGLKITKNEIPKTGNFILMPNHRSYIDILIVARFVPGTMLGKAEVGEWPLARTAAKLCQPVLIKRSVMKSLVEAMKKITESIQKNIPVVLFPEGTTYKGPLTKPFKNGSFKIAAEGQIPVIPAAIHYHDINDAWVGNDTFIGHFFRQLGKPTTKVEIKFGSPIVNSDYKLLQTETKQHIEKMLLQIMENKI